MHLKKCRICLDELEEGSMLNLFEESNATGIGDGDGSLKIYQIVQICCGVKIRHSKDLSSLICFKCFDLTRIWDSFRQMCIDAQVYLESLCKDKECYPKGFDFEDENAYLEYLLLDISRTHKYASSNEYNINNVDECGNDSMNYEFSIISEDSKCSIEESQINSSVVASPHGMVNRKWPLENIDGCDDDEVKAESILSDMLPKANRLKRPGKSDNAIRKTIKHKAPMLRNLRNQSTKLITNKKYMCSICGNVYSQKASFTCHMALHSDVKPHECELCGKAFRQVSELKAHMRRHTGEKPYSCTYCDRRFIDRSEKHRHERVHTNSRPYICDVCGKAFTYSTILKNHYKLHTGQKDYMCNICQKSFALPHQLKAHLQTLTHRQKESNGRADSGSGGGAAAGYEIICA